MACLSDDIVYINQPIVGQTDVRNIVAGIMELSKAANWELRNCFGYGNTAVTERLDCWDFDGNGLKQLCIGMFDVNDAGLIVITERLDQ